MHEPLPYSKINTVLLILLLGLSLGVLYVTLQNNKNQSVYTLPYNAESRNMHEGSRTPATPEYLPTTSSTPSIE